MDLWKGSGEKKTLNKERFLDCMEKHWRDWAAATLSSKEKRAWKRMVETIYKGKVKEMSDLPSPDTWVDFTSYKVLFPKDFFRSRYAALAQIEFPRADLAKWEPNTSGPTTHPDFKQNRFIKQKMLGELFRQAAELSKRSWSCEPPESSTRPSKRPCLSSVKEAPADDAGPLISKPNGVLKVLSNMEKQLASVRAAAEANTKEATDALRQAHKEELQKVWKYTDDTIISVREGHRKEMADAKKAHEEELARVRGSCKVAMDTLSKACVDGISKLEDARRKVDKVCLDGTEKARPEKTK